MYTHHERELFLKKIKDDYNKDILQSRSDVNIYNNMCAKIDTIKKRIEEKNKYTCTSDDNSIDFAVTVGSYKKYKSFDNNIIQKLINYYNINKSQCSKCKLYSYAVFDAECIICEKIWKKYSKYEQIIKNISDDINNCKGYRQKLNKLVNDMSKNYNNEQDINMSFNDSIIHHIKIHCLIKTIIGIINKKSITEISLILFDPRILSLFYLDNDKLCYFDDELIMHDAIFIKSPYCEKFFIYLKCFINTKIKYFALFFCNLDIFNIHNDQFTKKNIMVNKIHIKKPHFTYSFMTENHVYKFINLIQEKILITLFDSLIALRGVNDKNKIVKQKNILGNIIDYDYVKSNDIIYKINDKCFELNWFSHYINIFHCIYDEHRDLYLNTITEEYVDNDIYYSFSCLIDIFFSKYHSISSKCIFCNNENSIYGSCIDCLSFPNKLKYDYFDDLTKIYNLFKDENYSEYTSTYIDQLIISNKDRYHDNLFILNRNSKLIKRQNNILYSILYSYLNKHGKYKSYRKSANVYLIKSAIDGNVNFPRIIANDIFELFMFNNKIYEKYNITFYKREVKISDVNRFYDFLFIVKQNDNIFKIALEIDDKSHIKRKYYDILKDDICFNVGVELIRINIYDVSYTNDKYYPYFLNKYNQFLLAFDNIITLPLLF